MGNRYTSGDEKVDLHIHTCASDGTWTPMELVEKVKEKNIKVFAVTDHDTIASVNEVEKICKDEDLIFIPAVEINCAYNEMWVHILAYNIDVNSIDLNELLERNLKKLEDVDNEGLFTIAKVDKRIDLKEFEEYTHRPTRGGWRALNYLIDKGVCYDAGSFFGYFREHGLELAKAEFEPLSSVLEIVKMAGGVSVLAHPGSNMLKGREIEDTKRLLHELTNMGVNGIECFHPHNNEEITNYCYKWCEKNEMVVTGGSDCHGEFEKSRKLGYPDVRMNMLRNIEKIVKNKNFSKV